MSDKLPQLLDTCAIPSFEIIDLDAKLATIFGLNEAIVLDRIRKMCDVSDVHYNGYKWASIVTTKPRYYHLDFMTPTSLKRALTSLRIKKIIVSVQLDENPMVKINSYRINQETLTRIVENWDGISQEYNGNARYISENLKQKILNRDNRMCKQCGDTENLSIDHKLPISRGGSNKEHNLQILCLSCNYQKGTKTMDEWLGGVK